MSIAATYLERELVVVAMYVSDHPHIGLWCHGMAPFRENTQNEILFDSMPFYYSYRITFMSFLNHPSIKTM